MTPSTAGLSNSRTSSVANSVPNIAPRASLNKLAPYSSINTATDTQAQEKISSLRRVYISLKSARRASQEFKSDKSGSLDGTTFADHKKSIESGLRAQYIAQKTVPNAGDNVQQRPSSASSSKTSNVTGKLETQSRGPFINQTGPANGSAEHPKQPVMKASATTKMRQAYNSLKSGYLASQEFKRDESGSLDGTKFADHKKMIEADLNAKYLANQAGKKVVR